MPTSSEGKVFTGIAATTAAFALTGGKYIASARATDWMSFSGGTLQFGTNPTDADTVTIGSTVYRFKNTMSAVNDVQREATAAATLQHLVNTINGTGVAGTDYFAGSASPHATVSASIVGATMSARARSSGSGGNSIATTQTITGGADTWGGATLSGGGTAGSCKLQMLGPDASTWISPSSGTDFTADAVAAPVDLPPGQFRFTIAVASGLYPAVTRVPY